MVAPIEPYLDLHRRQRISVLCALGSQILGPLSREQMVEYVNFYGNLTRSSDKHLVDILAALEEQRILDNTMIIKTSDHGEMGLAHGGLRQKNFNMYEETIRVPLTFCNTKLYKGAFKCDAMVSHADFLPTIASLFGVPPEARTSWEGVDYSTLIFNPNGKPVQDYTVFTYDDYQSGQTSPIYPRPNNHIVSIREEGFKIAQYYSLDDTKAEPEWERRDRNASLATPGPVPGARVAALLAARLLLEAGT